MNFMLASILMLLSWADAGDVKWEKVPGGLTRISKGNSGVWGVNKDDDIFKLNDDGSSWTRISGQLVQVSSGASVWGVNRGGNIYKYNGNGWLQISGQLVNVAVSNKGRVWGVNSGGNIYRWTGSNWQNVPGIPSAKQVSVGESGVWVVNSSDEIFYRTGTVGDINTDGSGWTKVAGALKWISSGKGTVVGVNGGDSIYYRKAVSSSNPTGTRWEKVSGKLMQIDVDGDQVVGVNSVHNIYRTPTFGGCLCNNVNDEEFDLTDVVYDVKNGVVTEMPPRNVATKKLENGSSQPQTTVFSVSRTITETSSFSHTAGASVTVGTSFSVGVPFIASGEVSVDVSASYSYSSGTQKSEAKTVNAEFRCNGAPSMITECEALLFRDEMKVPYTRTWTKKEDKTCVCEDSGVFTKVAGSHLEMNTVERQLS